MSEQFESICHLGSLIRDFIDLIDPLPYPAEEKDLIFLEAMASLPKQPLSIRKGAAQLTKALRIGDTLFPLQILNTMCTTIRENSRVFQEVPVFETQCPHLREQIDPLSMTTLRIAPEWGFLLCEDHQGNLYTSEIVKGGLTRISFSILAKGQLHLAKKIVGSFHTHLMEHAVNLLPSEEDLAGDIIAIGDCRDSVPMVVILVRKPECRWDDILARVPDILEICEICDLAKDRIIYHPEASYIPLFKESIITWLETRTRLQLTPFFNIALVDLTHLQIISKLGAVWAI